MKRRPRLPAALLLGIGGALVLSIAAGLTGCGQGDLPAATDVSQPPNPVSTPLPLTAVQPGVFDDRVLFGQSAAFSGPAQQLGSGMRLGIQAAFHEANQRGGVHDRQLELLSLDDTYEPEAAIANTTRLIEEQAVFALIGAVGTPTSRSAAPIAAEAGVPYVAPFTGAAFLREAHWDNVVNLRASYYQETEEMVARLTGDLGLDRIAVMYQDDSFGRAGYQGARQALGRRNMEPVAVGLYPRNTISVKTGVLDLLRATPQAVILIGAYQPIAAVISWARHIGMDPVFMTVSFVGSNALADELGPAGEGTFVTQVVPFPTDDSVPIIAAYLDALSTYASDAVPAFGFVSLEGYLAGRLAIFGLDGCGRQVDRTCFLHSLLQSETIDLNGFQLQYGEQDNQGSDAVFLTVIGQDGRYYPVDTLLQGRTP